MPLASFDLEIAKRLPDTCPSCGKTSMGKLDGIDDQKRMVKCSRCGYRATVADFKATDWKLHRPLGISCAAVHYEDDTYSPITYSDRDRLTREQCQELVKDLTLMVNRGYTLLTWNGLSFDFDVLAEESGLLDECAKLAMNHIDMMFMVFAWKGHFLALEAACQGAGLKGKEKRVILSTGEILDGMNGALAPDLWADGEQQAVLDYLAGDVKQTLELANAINERGGIGWTAKSGRANFIKTPLMTVRECLALPEPDTSWMKNPMKRVDLMSWIEPQMSLV